MNAWRDIESISTQNWPGSPEFPQQHEHKDGTGTRLVSMEISALYGDGLRLLVARKENNKTMRPHNWSLESHFPPGKRQSS
jgi:hypothetical protein